MWKALRSFLSNYLPHVVTAIVISLFLLPFLEELLRRLQIHPAGWVELVFQFWSDSFGRGVSLFGLGLTAGAWGHSAVVKFDRRIRPPTDGESVRARARAIAHELAGRVRYAREVLEEGDPQKISKWLKKIDFQRISFSSLPPERDGVLQSSSIEKLALVRSRSDELERCIDNIQAGRGYETEAHAVGLYRQRASKLLDALDALVADLGGSDVTAIPERQRLPAPSAET